MEQPMRSLSTVISEASETLPSSKRKWSIKGMDSKKRMIVGADGKNNVDGSKTMDKTGENEFTSADKSRKGLSESRPSTLDSLRALAGGEQSKEYPSTSSLLHKEDSVNRNVDDGPICFCGSRPTGLAGKGKKIEEIIDYGIQNLNEAGEALNNLGDCFENDLRLMFMDIMGRVQHSISIVQNRVHAAKADLESLEKESVKDLELEELRRKLKEVEEKLATQQSSEIAEDVASHLIGEASQAEEERVSTSVQTVDSSKDRAKEGDKVQSKTGSLVNTGCQCGDNHEEEGGDREAELEAELAQVLEENERMMREREEYENAIHCALLRGVSSLNVEAFKVLRCPPIACCSPCRPPSTPRSASPETVVTYRPMNTKCDTQRVSKSVSKSDKSRERNNAANVNRCLLQPLSEHLLYCSRGNERSQENNMLFLLHHGDAGNSCEPCIQPRHRPSGSLTNKGSVCTGGKCRKAGATAGAKDKVSCPARSPGSRAASFDLCVRTRDDPGENGTVNKKSINKSANRCGTCNRNRTRNTDE